ncbi:MAG: TIGR02594 family protein [Phycisphaerales bacterium]|nr:MAG: TIGR02594 family protein [Phycisphaerales bacterium]
MAFNLDEYTGGSEERLYDHLKSVWERAQRRFGHEGDAVYAFQEDPCRVNLLAARGFADGQPVESTNERYDDALFVIWKDEGGQKRVRTFVISTEYGESAGGTALLVLGQHKYKLATHKKTLTRKKLHEAGRYDPAGGNTYQYRALNPHPTVQILRDSVDRNRTADAGEGVEDNATINVHYGGEYDTSASSWSEGCQVLLGWDNYREFIALVERDASIVGSIENESPGVPVPPVDGTRPVIYTLVEGEYLLPADSGYGYPIRLNGSLAVDSAHAARYYEHTERQYKGGYFPFGTNTVWHGGLHVHARRGEALVHACAAGELVAARLFEDEAQGHGHYGSVNFILLKHEIAGAVLNQINQGPVTEYQVLTSNLNFRPEAGGAESYGKLVQGDRLAPRDGDAVSKDGYEWLPMTGLQTQDASLIGKDGYVAFKKEWLKPIHAGGPSAFADSDRKTWYSLYMHLNPERIEEANAALAGIEWLRTSGPAGFRTNVPNLPMRDLPDESQPFVKLARGAELMVIDPAPAAAKVGGYNWQYVQVTGGDNANAARTGWIPAQAEWVETTTATTLNAELVEKLRAGGVVCVGEPDGPVRVKAGDPLWTVGEYGSPDYRDGLIHWEIFSEENLMPSWPQAVDADENYNMDCRQIMEMIEQEWFGSDDVLSKEEVENFFASDPDAARLRQWACQFVIEWGIDLDVALPQLKNVCDRWRTSQLKERIAPYLWWDEAAGRSVPLPGTKKVWHYNPVALLERWATVYGAVESSPDGGDPSRSSEPPWIRIARGEIGVKEVSGDEHNERVLEYLRSTSLQGTSDAEEDETPWCSAFVNWVMKQTGRTGTDSAMAISWAAWGRRLAAPAFGAIASIKWHQQSADCSGCTEGSRCQKASRCLEPADCGCACTKGHVGFVVGKSGDKIQLLGGNQSNEVNVSGYGTDRIIAYVVPSDYEVPADDYDLKPYGQRTDEGDFDSTR